MSVKMMTTEQIQQDLAGIHNMWSGGIPAEQQDRVNALRGELKRRGAEIRAARPDEMPEVKARVLSDMSEEDLGKELRMLSERIGKDPGNDELQEQFANVRYEMRKRTKNGNGQLAQSELKKVAAFNPETGQTDLQEAAFKYVDHSDPNGGVAKNLLGSIPRRSEDELKQEFLAAQAAHIANAQEQARKFNMAKLAGDITGQILRAVNVSDVDGDMVEEACTLGVKVAESIYAKVGL